MIDISFHLGIYFMTQLSLCFENKQYMDAYNFYTMRVLFISINTFIKDFIILSHRSERYASQIAR